MRLIARAIVCVPLLIPVLAQAIDLQPNDIVAPAPDKTFAMLSYYGTENRTFYRNGSAASGPAPWPHCTALHCTAQVPQHRHWVLTHFHADHYKGLTSK